MVYPSVLDNRIAIDPGPWSSVAEACTLLKSTAPAKLARTEPRGNRTLPESLIRNGDMTRQLRRPRARARSPSGPAQALFAG